jgi:signal transduction histidine kinase
VTSILEKRLSLNKNLQDQRQLNNDLKSQITQLQTLANVGTTTYMVAHEINNLLTPLGSFAELALKHPDDKALIEKALQKAVRNCEQASKIMESMLAVADGETQDKKNISLMTLVQEVFACLCRDFAKDRITVNIEIAEDLNVCGVPVQIQQVLMNLILNARDAMLPHSGLLTIKARDTDTEVQIEVADTGCGINQADLENIFEPFFTTKNNKNSPSRRSGAGLGLVFCKRIIDEHGGSISVQSKPTEGTAFKITLPKPSQGSSG